MERHSETGRDVRKREEYERLNQVAKDAEQQLEREKGRLIEVSEKGESAQVKTDEALKSWAEALHLASLPTDLDPGEAQNSVSQLIELRGQLSGVNVLKERIDGIVRILSHVETRLGPVLEQADLPGFSAEQATGALEDLAKRFNEHQSAAAQVKILRIQDDEWGLDRQKLLCRQSDLAKSKELLLKKAGCADEENFRTLGVQITDRHDLEHDLSALQRSEPLLINDEGRYSGTNWRSIPKKLCTPHRRSCLKISNVEIMN